MNTKYIFWYSYYNCLEPSVRYRALLPLNILKSQKKIDFHIYTPDRSLKGLLKLVFAFILTIKSNPENTLIIIQKVYTNGFYFKVLKTLINICSNHKLIYDIDDADYIKRDPSSINYFVKKSDKVLCGSNALINHLSNFNPNCELLGTGVVINPMDKKSRKKDSLKIIWIGFIHAHFLAIKNQIFPALKKLNCEVEIAFIGKNKNIDSEVIHELFKGESLIFASVYTILNWDDHNFINQIISEYDFGIAPLMPSEYNKAKSAFRLKQLMANSLPIIGSNWGEQENIINEKNGFICNNSDEYYEAFQIAALMNNKDYFFKSYNAKNDAIRFSIENYSEKLWNVINETKKDYKKQKT